MAQTQTAKGLTYLNLAAILGMIVLFILVPALDTIIPVISNRLAYALSIIFIVFNVAFYVVPQNLKIIIFKRRVLTVYLPTLVVLGFAVWNLFYIIIHF